MFLIFILNNILVKYIIMELMTKFNIGDYVIINNKYTGYVHDVIWNSNGYIVKLDNEDGYIDKTLSQYKLIELDDARGYMLATLNDKIEKFDVFKLEKNIMNLHSDDVSKIINKINYKYDNFLINIKKTSNIYSSNIYSSNLEQELKQEQNIYQPNKFPIYDVQLAQDEDYVKYITKMINDLFITNTQVKWNENFYMGEGKSIDILGQENLDEIIKPVIRTVLEKFDPIDKEQYYDFKNTLMYKHIIYDDHVDTLSLGKEIIKMIKKMLIDVQEKIELDDGTLLLEKTNLFDFLDFKIVGGYIEISNINLTNDFRVITPELVPNLIELSFQYLKSIDYNILTSIVLENKTSNDVEINKTMVDEALKILAQEYLICFQPKVEVLLWTICRIILSWFSDPGLYDNICKIKILVNLFRARGTKEFNRDNGILPIIMIVPKYGKKIATKVLSHLSYFFFPYKKLGLETSKPSWFDSIDHLMYYTNGSLELKKYIKFLFNAHNKFTNPLTKDMTQIKTPYQDNKIEYILPH